MVLDVWNQARVLIRSKRDWRKRAPARQLQALVPGDKGLFLMSNNLTMIHCEKGERSGAPLLPYSICRNFQQVL